MPEVELQPPYHINYQDYAYLEGQLVLNFAQTEFPHVLCPRGPRDGIVRIEIPSVDHNEVLVGHLVHCVAAELTESHPLLRRRNMNIRFVNDLIDPIYPQVEVGGDITELTHRNSGKKEYLVRVALSDITDPMGDSDLALVVARVVHEIAECDYYLKSRPDLVDAKDISDSNYPYHEDEEVANKRALRRVREMFPNSKVDWVGINYDKVD